VTVGQDQPGNGQDSPNTDDGVVESDKDADLTNATFYKGQEIYLDLGESFADAQLTLLPFEGGERQTGETEFIFADGDGEILIDTGDLTDRPNGRYELRTANDRRVDFDGDGQIDSTDGRFQLFEQDLNLEFDDSSINTDGEDTETDFEAESNRGQYLHDLTAELDGDDVDADDLQDLFGGAGTIVDSDAGDYDETEVLQVPGTNDDAFAANFDEDVTDLEVDGSANFTITSVVNDTDVSDTAEIVVQETGDGEAFFEPQIVADERGDTPYINATLTNTDEVTFRVGSNELNYLANVTVEDDDDDGFVSIKWNTHLAARPDTTVDEVFTDGDDETDILSAERGSSPLDSDFDERLDAASYTVEAEVSGDSSNVGSVRLQDADSVSRVLRSWRARADLTVDADDTEDSVLGNVNRSNTIAEGDYVVLQGVTGGIFGYVNSPEDLTENENGIEMTIEQTDRDALANEENEEIDFAELDGVKLNKSPSSNTFFLIMETDEGNFEVTDREQDNNVEGTEYEAELEIVADDPSGGPENPYVDENRTVSTVFTVVQREVEIDTPATSDDLRLQQAAGQVVRGTAPVADGSEVTIEVRSEGDSPYFESQTVEVSNGTFSAEFDLSSLPPGTNVTVEVDETETGQRFSDEVDGVITQPSTVTFNDQTASQIVTVEQAYLPNGGFVVIHDSSLLDGAVIESVVGTSGYLSAGTSEDVRITLDEPLEAGSNPTLIAMTHQDTDDDQRYDFTNTEGAVDGPYVLDGDAVTDDASITVEEDAPETVVVTETVTEEVERTVTVTVQETVTVERTVTVEVTPEGGSGGDGPGFGIAVAILALLSAAALAARRRD
jgi:PGF-CTERM protein